MAKGRQSTNGIVVASPTEMDVLCSKDKSVSKHPGNLVFRERIEQVTKRYSAASSKQEKMKITRDIVTFMQMKHGARFLKQDDSVWMEITDQAARDKVSHALRFAAKNLGVSRPSPVQKQQGVAKKKQRKPSISSQSTVSTASSKSDSSTDLSVYDAQDEEYTPEPITNSNQSRRHAPVASIFMRQQSILTTMHKKMVGAVASATTADGYMDFAEFQAKSLSNHMMQPEFNTLRSEDLNDLLRDPMFDSIGEWEVVGQMAECWFW